MRVTGPSRDNVPINVMPAGWGKGGGGEGRRRASGGDLIVPWGRAFE